MTDEKNRDTSSAAPIPGQIDIDDVLALIARALPKSKLEYLDTDDDLADSA